MLGLTPQERRAVATVTLVLFAVVAIIVGCGSSGGRGTGGGTNPGTAVGSYTVTLMATPPNGSGAVAQSTTIMLTVQ